MAVVLAALGVLLVAAGCALIYPPLGLIVAGVQAIFAAYVVLYLSARRAR